MNWKRNNDTVVFEGKILYRSAKSYMVEIDMGLKYFVPLSQIIEMSQPDIDGNIEFIVTDWWWGVKEPLDD